MSVNIFRNLGGGEEPPKKGESFKSQQEIAAANNWVRDLLARQNADPYLVQNSVVARNVGDSIPAFIQRGTRPAMVQRATTLPFGISINDVVETNEGYGYYDNQSGRFIPVDAQAIFGRYGKQTSK